jgi:8-oxo-dGTP pyrophosphatase MutT (NUDIX family)
MHRRPLLDLLGRYEARHPDEAGCAERIRQLVTAHADCFERSCLPGHVTASAWIVSADRRHFLLAHHRKLGRWLQLGGHADGDPDVLAVALREAREESGLREFRCFEDPAVGGPLLLDIDVHTIPARADEPEHEHHDLRFLLLAAAGQDLHVSPESNELAWREIGRLEQYAPDASLLRMGLKAQRWLA